MTTETTTLSERYAALAALERDGVPVLLGLRKPCRQMREAFPPFEWRRDVHVGPDGSLHRLNGCPGYTVVEDMGTLLVALRDAGYVPNQHMAVWRDDRWCEFEYVISSTDRFSLLGKASDPDPHLALVLAACDALGV